MSYYALIMAGGIGTRLWPRSRGKSPKQFLDLTGKETMLRMASQRLDPLIAPDHTLIATNQDYVEIVSSQLPDVPLKNILGEPVGRGTAAAIGLAAIHINKVDPNAIMAVLTADHLIEKTDVFRDVLAAAAQMAEKGWLVTMGIKPSYPETGYGYIEQAEKLTDIGSHGVYQVARFVEKPNAKVAQKYLESGKFVWNSGMFIWKVERILEEMETHMPVLYQGLMKIESSIGTSSYQEVFATVFPQLPNETIDYGIMEKAQAVAVLPVDIGWNDIGSWSAVYDVIAKDENANVTIGANLIIETHGSLIISPKRLVAAVGLDDLMIIDTDDVLLTCPRSRAQNVKDLVEMLKSQGKTHFL